MKVKKGFAMKYIGIAAVVIATAMVGSGCAQQASQPTSYSSEAAMKTALTTKTPPPPQFLAISKQIKAAPIPAAPKHP
jgi:hypothetical protein